MSTRYTPTPWAIMPEERNLEDGFPIDYPHRGAYVYSTAMMGEPVTYGPGAVCEFIHNAEDAALIVRAVNVHDALLAALHNIEAAAVDAQGDWACVDVPYAPMWTMPYKEIASAARAAIDAAEKA